MPRPIRRAVARATFASAEIVAAMSVARLMGRSDGLAAAGSCGPSVGSRGSGVAGRGAAAFIDRPHPLGRNAVVGSRTIFVLIIPIIPPPGKGQDELMAPAAWIHSG
jgi:hypothetical protein